MHSIAWWPTLIVLAIATFTDLRSCRIPNWLVLPFLVAGVIASGWTNGWHGVGQSLLGICLGAVVLGFFCWMGGMGMGDMKLCAAVGAWIGPSQLLVALVVMGIAGGIMALCWAVGGGFVGELFDGTGDLIVGVKKHGLRPHPELTLGNPITRKMPYAPAIAVGTIISFFSR
ncbi:MAG TPA: A24 family peptidase [Acidobacteriaceae bacterium]|jgi:prepilin peptidase CpaA|nr:A24 family peptidase [Acidobacteriaceae bacterium]